MVMRTPRASDPEARPVTVAVSCWRFSFWSTTEFVPEPPSKWIPGGDGVAGGKIHYQVVVGPPAEIGVSKAVHGQGRGRDVTPNGDGVANPIGLAREEKHVGRIGVAD